SSMVIPGSCVLWSVQVAPAMRWTSASPASRSWRKFAAGYCCGSSAITQTLSCARNRRGGTAKLLDFFREFLDRVDQHRNQAGISDAQMAIGAGLILIHRFTQHRQDFLRDEAYAFMRIGELGPVEGHRAQPHDLLQSVVEISHVLFFAQIGIVD